MRLLKTLPAWAAVFLFLGGTAFADSVQRLVLPTNDMVYDPVDGQIYASIPSRAGTLGNSIAAIDPQSGSVTNSIPVGSEPGKLALSDDGHFLYVGLDGAGAVRRVDLAKQAAELKFSLGRQGAFEGKPGPNFVEDMRVLPGHPESVIVSRRSSNSSPRHSGVVVYDNGVPRPNILAYHNGNNVIAFGEPPSRLYGYDQESSEFGFRRMTIDASGVLPGDTIAGLITGVVDMKYDGGRIFTSSGLIVDPEAASVVGQFPEIPSELFGTAPYVLVLPSSADRRVYFLGGDSVPRLRAFDPLTRKPYGTVDVPYSSGLATSLIRWGEDGLAFRTGSDELFLIHSALVPSGDLALRFPRAGVIGGGTAEAGLTLREPAPDGGLVVTLRSDDPALAAVPAQVTVPAGAVTATFSVVTATVARTTLVAVSARAGAASSRAVLRLLPPAALSMALRLSAVVGGASGSGTVTLSSPAPPDGRVVQLRSDHPAVAAVPAAVEVPAGAVSVTFSIVTSPVLQNTPVTLSAGYSGANETARLTVLAPGPGGPGTAIVPIKLPVADLVYDPVRGRIYASVPGSGGSLANSVAVIDPSSGAIEGSFFAGSEPGKLALSDDGRFLYVALDGSASIRRLDLTTGTAEPPFPVGSGPFGPYRVDDMRVAPGSPRTLAVARVDPRSRSQGGVTLFDDGVPRPATTPWLTGPTVLAYSASPSRLYGYNNRVSEFGFYQMSIDPSGVAIRDEAAQLIYNFDVGIQYADGLIYASSGRVIDPEALELRGTFAGIPFESLMAADAGIGRVFFLTRDGTRWMIRANEQHTFRPLGAIEIPGVSGVPGSLIRCGPAGLAFRTDAGQVFLVRTPLAPSEALSVRLDPGAAVGGLSVAGTIALGSAAPAGGAVIDLTTDRSDLVLLPPRVTVPEGGTEVSFPVVTSPVARADSAALTATYGGVSRTVDLPVRPEALLSLTLQAKSLVGGEATTGTVELGSPAPPGGLAVALSGNLPALKLPATVSVPAGAMTATFPVDTEPVPVDTPAILTATLEGSTRTAALEIQAPILLGVAVAPTRITAGDRAAGWVTISSPAPKDGLEIELYSSSENVIVPESVTVPAGATGTSFPITTRPVDHGGQIRIAAEYGLRKQAAYLSVLPRPVITLLVSPERVLGGQPAAGTVKLTDPAPAGGAVITLQASAPSPGVTIPPSVTIAPGDTTATFSVTTQPVQFDASVNLSATWAGKSAVTTLYVTDPIPVSFTLQPTVVEGGATAEATVTLDAPARTGGRLLRLSTDRPSAAEVPLQIVVPAGARMATFPVTTHPVSASTVVTIAASTSFFTAGTTLTVAPAPPAPSPPSNPATGSNK